MKMVLNSLGSLLGTLFFLIIGILPFTAEAADPAIATVRDTSGNQVQVKVSELFKGIKVGAPQPVRWIIKPSPNKSETGEIEDIFVVVGGRYYRVAENILNFGPGVEQTAQYLCQKSNYKKSIKTINGQVAGTKKENPSDIENPQIYGVATLHYENLLSREPSVYSISDRGDETRYWNWDYLANATCSN